MTLVREAVERIMPVGRLRYVGFSHFEADECGALNQSNATSLWRKLTGGAA
ncbi:MULTISPECIES: hypothetical protein [unclassified Cupriavidus]|uniref:hypothetical protein n=1 Tax=unclassified Cupriavidus TaxID=2640874 RepID=UPI00040DB525